ncbi:hypothetical protein FHN55_18815 [Streptomyces sp. NP160]|uniref:hypothetical protein n=1 Tax=Streptomyces sp. NP160 TaxID=2586637 RepID=UPI00111B80C9|nr:hypothetical protein [Streptomyces sp. NP160]TNM60189.1 hypothetical protein FHN55_18815 [Streptomyces sp. NP160]
MVHAARSASRAALAVVVLTLLVVTAACGAADPAGGPPSETSSPPGGPCDTAVGQGDETTRALVGLSEAEATQRAGDSGLQVRVAGRGTECYALTADHRPDRVNLTLDEDGTVLAAGRG